MIKRHIGGALLCGLLLHAMPAIAAAAPISSASSATIVDAAAVAAPMHVLSRPEVVRFLAQARAAEAIKDPLKRCLDYPDPPGSHWMPVAVRSYCHYKNQPLLGPATIEQLLRNGKMAELDQRLQALWQAQQADPDAAARLNLSYTHAFSDDFEYLRPLLEAWKQASPHSAFAYAASGWLYGQVAGRVRGGDYIDKTPAAQVQQMKQLVNLAESDLNHALALDPRFTPAYFALIQASNMTEGRDYTELLIEKALAVAPADFSLYNIAMVAREPRWGGSIEAMQALAERAHAHIAENPMLEVFRNYPTFYRIDTCECGAAQQAKDYASLLDRLSIATQLSSAGDTVAVGGDSLLAMVLLSEALRFAPTDAAARSQRSLQLSAFGDPRWALAEADLAIGQAPTKASGYQARGLALETMQDYRGAETALRKAIALDDDNPWQKIELGNIYGYRTLEWAKAWALAEEITQRFPEQPDAWVLRAQIQANEPRAGMALTLKEFMRRFGNDPAQQGNLAQMRAVLIKQTEQATAASSLSGPSPATSSVAH